MLWMKRGVVPGLGVDPDHQAERGEQHQPEGHREREREAAARPARPTSTTREHEQRHADRERAEDAADHEAQRHLPRPHRAPTARR